ARIDALLAGVPSHWRTTLGPLLRWRPDERPTARDAEDALARELGRTVFDVRAWCREHAVSPPSSPGPLTGALLTEGADGELLAIAPQATGETGRMWLVVTAVVLLLLLLGLGGSVGAIVIGTLTVASQTVASGVSYEGCVGSTSDALDRLREAHGDGVDRGIAAAERIRAACPTAGLMGAASFATAVDAALEDGEVSVADAVLLERSATTFSR
ncbi:MAG: hypothetical protein KC656_09020, partial [Myxococcales bacterium]|nr:hypothetical protein [Myxococcales bacterium]